MFFSLYELCNRYEDKEECDLDQSEVRFQIQIWLSWWTRIIAWTIATSKDFLEVSGIIVLSSLQIWLDKTQLTILLKKYDYILGTFYHDSLRAQIFKTLKTSRSQIKTKGFLKIGEAMLWFLAQNINPIPHGVFWITHTWGGADSGRPPP